MEHEDAIRLQAAERYVARELPATERDAFEAHFFDCTDCAEDVRFELTFAANVRAVLREPASAAAPAPEAVPSSVWRRWRERVSLRPVLAFSWAGNFVLAAALAFLVLAVPREAAGPHFTSIYFAPGPAHGADDVHSLAAGDTVYMVSFPAPARKSSEYSYEIRDEAGKSERSGSLRAPQSQEETLYLQVPVKNLREGVHTLEVRSGGAAGDLVSRSRFRNSP